MFEESRNVITNNLIKLWYHFASGVGIKTVDFCEGPNEKIKSLIDSELQNFHVKR